VLYSVNIERFELQEELVDFLGIDFETEVFVKVPILVAPIVTLNFFFTALLIALM
jgi:hypothetical protein